MYVCEELIVQSSQMAALHPNSINTIRITTILTDNNNVVVFYPFLKVGQKGSFVDNAGSGGIIVQIDPNSGKLCSGGYDESNVRYAAHPDTGVIFNGYQLPEFSNAVSLAKKLALVRPGCRYVGWDLAHTDKGWVMVEGNSRGQFIGQQVCDKIGKKSEMDDIMKNVQKY